MTKRQSAAGGRYRIIDTLNEEWAALADEPNVAVQRWSGEHLELAGCATLADVLASVRRNPDGSLGALLLECRTGDALAGRTVLQAMLGKVVRMVARDRHATSDDYVTAMWFRICTYPLASRATRIAANLSLDTLKTVTSEARRSSDGILLPTGPVLDWLGGRAVEARSLDHSGMSEVNGRDLLKAAADLGLIDAGTQRVLQSIYVDGLTSDQAAVLHNLSAVNVRYRCSRAVRRLAEHSATLVEAA